MIKRRSQILHKDAKAAKFCALCDLRGKQEAKQSRTNRGEQRMHWKSWRATEIGSHDFPKRCFGTEFGSIGTDFSGKAPQTVSLESKMITFIPFSAEKHLDPVQQNQK
ncbi:MAG TPA: hypothetical protein VNU68_00850 [Verrucomicrobiae bacterium]|nr:hypothetical protein [Verrucomicrobiae bacterium]